MARPTSANQFLERVRAAGGRMGNGPLQKALAWGDSKYWSVHQELFDAGAIEKGRGRGGTVILVVPNELAPAADESSSALESIEEAGAIRGNGARQWL